MPIERLSRRDAAKAPTGLPVCRKPRKHTNTVESVIKAAPGFAYEGGKYTLREWIIPAMLERCGTGSLFVEPFAGRGNVFWAFAQVSKFRGFQLNDLRTWRFFNAIKTVDLSRLPAQLLQVQKKQLVDMVRRHDDLVYIIEPWCFFSSQNISEDNTYIGGSFDHYNPAAVYRLYSICRQILTHYNPTITNLPFDKLPWLEWDESVLAYLDPPYFKADVASYRDSTVDFGLMIDLLKRTRARWFLSEYRQDMYIKAFGPPKHMKSTRNYMSLKAGKQSRERVECLWCSPNIAA